MTLWRRVLCLGGLLLVAGASGAEPAPGGSASKTKGEADTRLSAVLKEWDQTRHAHGDLHYKFTYTPLKTDPRQMAESDIRRVEVFLRRPDRILLKEWDSKDRPAFVVLCIGPEARLYDFQQKKELVFALPPDVRFPERGERCTERAKLTFCAALVEGLAWTALGPPLGNLGGRFTLTLEKEDDHWTYLTLNPKKKSGWLPDAEWQVVLDRKSRWVRRVWRKQGWADGLTVDFEEPDKTPLPPEIWEPPFKKLPEGWEKLEGAWPEK